MTERDLRTASARSIATKYKLSCKTQRSDILRVLLPNSLHASSAEQQITATTTHGHIRGVCRTNMHKSSSFTYRRHVNACCPMIHDPSYYYKLWAMLQASMPRVGRLLLIGLPAVHQTCCGCMWGVGRARLNQVARWCTIAREQDGRVRWGTRHLGAKDPDHQARTSNFAATTRA